MQRAERAQGEPHLPGRLLFQARAPLFGLALGLIAASVPSQGAEITAQSRITAVTVFPQGAEVTRSVDVDLAAGEHNVIIVIPGELQRQNLRVGTTKKDALAIRTVDVRILPPKADDPARQEIETEIEQLGDERTALDQSVADTELSRKLVALLAERRLQPQGEQAQPAVLPPPELSALLDLVGGRITQLSKSVLEARIRQRAISRRIDELQRRLTDLAAKTPKQSQLSINVVAANQTRATLQVGYLLAAASWHPVYNLRLDTGEGGQPRQLTLVRSAEVSQATAEPWSNVQLKLSTIKPTGATRPPGLQAWELHSFADLRRFQQVQQDKAVQRGAAPSASLDNPSAGSSSVAEFQALYQIAGTVSVDNANTPKLVIIASDAMPAELSLKAVPRVDLTAYLLAHSNFTGATPLLPGKATLFRDGVFTGESELPRLAPGDAFIIGFGADDFVTIERRELSHKTGETGLVSSALVDEQSFLTTIFNRHAMAMPITILDQVPFATDSRIRVELLPDTDPPTSKDVDKQPGVYGWTRTLEPNSRTELRFGFRVIWPKDTR